MSITSTSVHRAEIRFHEAAEPLGPFVGCFWVVTAEPCASIRVVPDGSTSISIQFQQGRQAEWFLRGPLIRPDERRFTSPAVLVGIRLRPGVAFLVSRIPAHTLVGRRVRLSTIPACAEFAAAAPHPPTPEQSIAALEQFLLQRLERAAMNSTVAAALREIECAHGASRVPDLAAHCRVSPRHLHRLMREWVGYGPKRYASVIRFQNTLHGMAGTPVPTAAVLAVDNGYFDQAHLTLDVARFSGVSPSELTSLGVSDFSKTRCDDLP